MPPKKTTTTDPEGETFAAGPTIVVVAKQASRWRIGRKFGAEPVHIPLDDLTEAEAKALAEDPLLVVTAFDPTD